MITELTWLPQPGIATFEAVVKAASLPAGAPSPAGMRAALFASAQEAIRVVEEAGYAHDEQPVIQIDAAQQQQGDTTAI